MIATGPRLSSSFTCDGRDKNNKINSAIYCFAGVVVTNDFYCILKNVTEVVHFIFFIFDSSTLIFCLSNSVELTFSVI